MTMLAFSVEIDGEETTSEIDVSFDAARLSLQEMVRVESALIDGYGAAVGAEMAERFTRGKMPFTPITFQAILWAKLATQIPDLKLDGFDLPGEAFSTLGAADDADDSLESLEMPMTTDEETTVASIGG